MTRQSYVHRLPAGAPDDIAALEAAIADGVIDPGAVVAVLGKTEGNGNVNDWTRALAARALGDAFAARLGAEAAARICLVMSGGTEGALAPHWLVFEVRDSADDPVPGALAIGRVQTADLPPEAIGRLGQVRSVADGVRRAMREAGIAAAADVHLVQVKCPLLTSARIAAARARGADTVTADTLKSMALSRGAAALGVALALGEVAPAALTDAAIGRDAALSSARASCSAGVELMGHEIVVLGAGQGWSGPLRLAHAVMADALDVAPVRAALDRLGLDSAHGQLVPAARDRLVALIAKVEAAPDGTVRGCRHTMLTDSDIPSTRHARAFTGGVLAGLTGLTELFVSGGAEHQGPPGGGPVAIIARADA